MDASGLPPPSRAALERLEAMIRAALDAPSPHLRAVASGAITKGGNAYGSDFSGGLLHPVPNAEPPFDHDRGALQALFREVIGDAPGLRRVIVHCERESAGAGWTMRSKLVTGAEADALAKKRSAIDTKVKRELASLQTTLADAVVLNGRGPTAPPELRRFGKSGNEVLEPSTALLDHLAECERLYRGAGHELVHISWQLHNRSLRVSDHFE